MVRSSTKTVSGAEPLDYPGATVSGGDELNPCMMGWLEGVEYAKSGRSTCRISQEHCIGKL